MRKIIAFMLVMVMMVGCVPQETPNPEPVNEPVVEPDEPIVEEPVTQPDDEPLVLGFIFPLITKVDDGYTLRAGDNFPLIDETFESMSYIDNSRFVKAVRNDERFIVNMDTYEIQGPFTEDEFKIFLQREIYESTYISFWDKETYDYGYLKGEDELDVQYNFASSFVDGYGVIEEYGEFKVVDEDFDVHMTNDTKIINFGKEYFGKVIDFAVYDDYYNQVNLVTLNGSLVAENVFEVDVINDDLILVADHKKGWFIDSKGNDLDIEFIDEDILTYEEAILSAGYIVLLKEREDYSDYLVMTDLGEVIYESPKPEPVSERRISMGDGIKIYEDKITSSRFVKSIIPVIEKEGSDDTFDEVNQIIRDQYLLIDERPASEVWSTEEMSYEARRAGDRILELDMFLYWYGFGAAHPNYAKHTEHIDLVTGETYVLKDMLKSDDSFIALTAIAQEKAKEMGDMFYDINGVTIYEGISFKLMDEGIVFYYDPYEVGPYAVGMPEIFIPFEEIMDVIDITSPFYNAFKPVE